MAAFNFPNSPSTNDLHTENNVTWKWDGTMWNRVSDVGTTLTQLNVTGVSTFAGNVHVGGVLTYEDVKNVDSVGIITARTGLSVTAGDVVIPDTIVHAGDTNTKIRFPAADTFSVETAGLQNFKVNGTRVALTSPSGTNTTLRLQHQGNSGYGDIILDRQVNAFIIDNDPSNASNNQSYFSVKNKGTTNLHIKYDGKIGINTSSPARLIHAYESTNNNLLFLESGDTNVDIIQADTGGSTRIRNSQGSLVFYVNGDANSSSAANAVTGLTIDGDKDVHVYDDLFIPDKIIHEGDTNTAIRFPSADTITAETGGSERLRITSGGKTLIHGGGATGANDTATVLDNGNTLNIHGTSSSDGISVVRYSANYGAYGINIGKSRNNTFGTNTLVQDGNELGHISFYGADGTDFEMAAQITGLVDGAPATGGDGTDMPGALSFRTTPEGSDSPTERLRITAAGNLKIPDNAKIELGGAQTGGGDLYIQHAPAGSGSDTIHSNSAYLYINSDALRLNSKTSGWNYLRGDKSDGVVKLYKSNSAKLSTSDTGITVTGEVAATQDYPDYRPTLDFNFAAVKKLDSRFRYYRLGGASYIDENGLVKFVSENQPRFDHDPVTREPKGLLIEQTRTNLLRYSHGDGFKSQGHMNDYTVGWVQQDTTNSTITPNAALGPDGTMSALKYTLNATSGRRLDYEEVDLDNSTTYCWSWWMKRMASNAVWSFQFVSGTSPTGDQILIDGVAASGQTTTYTPPDDKWHRVTWKFTTQANADEQDLGGYDSSGGTGDRWLLWGAQLEAGAFPTSLIPTRGNKATRGSEEIHMGSDRDGSSALDRTILNIFDDHEGTIVAEWETQESETNQNLISFHKDLSSAERVEIRATGSSTSNVRAEIVTGGSSTASIQVAHGGLQKNTKAAFGFQKDNYSLSVNGSAVSSDTSGNMPSDINSLMIGKGTWGTYFDGHLKRFMYYPKNLPDSQLITLTS